MKNEFEIIQNLMHSLRDKTVITLSHKETNIIHSSCIYVLKEGKIVESGSYEELINKKKGEFTKLFLKK